jgi:hypothetical protein
VQQTPHHTELHGPGHRNLAFTAADFDPTPSWFRAIRRRRGAVTERRRTITGFYNIKPEVAGRAFNIYNTLASKYGQAD